MKKTLGHKRITSLALSLLLLLSAAPAALTASAAEVQNLTIDQINAVGDFEGETYSPINVTNSTLSITDENAYSGQKSLKVVANNDNAELLINPVALEKSSTFKLSLAVYYEKKVKDQAKINIQERQNWSTVLNSLIPKIPGKWRVLNFYFNTATNDRLYRIGFQQLRAGETLYFDDIKIEKVTGKDYIGKINNSDFEDTEYGLVEWSSESVWELTGETANTGDCSAYIYGKIGDADNGKSFNRWDSTNQFFCVEKNTDYILTYYAKCEDKTNSPIIKIHPAADESSNLLGGEKQLNQDAADRTVWNKNTLKFNSGNNDLLRLYLVVNNYGAYIDDISIKKALKATVSATGLGSAKASKTAFVTGDEITLTATPADGAVFSGWYDGETLISSDAVYTFAPTDSFSYTARFTEINGDVPEVKNAGFEENDLSAWVHTKDTKGNFAIEIVDTEHHSGSSSLRIKANGEVDRWTFSKIGVYVTPNTDYVLHFYGKRETQNSYSLVKIHGSINDDLIKGEQGINGLKTGYDAEGKETFDHTQWGLNEITFNSGNRNYINISFTVSLGASYVDDIYLARKVGTYKSENTEYGTVKGTAPTLCYGEEFTLTAEPNEGCEFTGWYNSKDELVSETPEYTNTLTSNESYVAKFAQKAPVSGDIDGNGEVNAQDLTLLRKVLLGAGTSDNADVNNDGNTDILDLIALKKMLVK